jgi:hypothetical protein
MKLLLYEMPQKMEAVILSTKLLVTLMAVAMIATAVASLSNTPLTATFALLQDNVHNRDANNSVSSKTERSNYFVNQTIRQDLEACSNDGDSSSPTRSIGGDDDAGMAAAASLVRSNDCLVEQSQYDGNNTYMKDFGDDYLDITGFTVNEDEEDQ